MRKGKTGILLGFYAAFAFLLALANQTLLCGLLLGFVIIMENDEWLTKQVIQAFGLSVIVTIITRIINILDFLTPIPLLGAIISAIISLITGLLSIAVLILAITSTSKVLRGQDASIPCINTFANWAFNYIGDNNS